MKKLIMAALMTTVIFTGCSSESPEEAAANNELRADIATVQGETNRYTSKVFGENDVVGSIAYDDYDADYGTVDLTLTLANNTDQDLSQINADVDIYDGDGNFLGTYTYELTTADIDMDANSAGNTMPMYIETAAAGLVEPYGAYTYDFYPTAILRENDEVDIDYDSMNTEELEAVLTDATAARDEAKTAYEASLPLKFDLTGVTLLNYAGEAVDPATVELGSVGSVDFTFDVTNQSDAAVTSYDGAIDVYDANGNLLTSYYDYFEGENIAPGAAISHTVNVESNAMDPEGTEYLQTHADVADYIYTFDVYYTE